MLEEIRRHSYSKRDEALLDRLKKKYIEKWKEFEGSRAKGPATGKVLEEFVKKVLEEIFINKGVKLEPLCKAKLEIVDGVFYEVDLLYTWKGKKTLIEVKIYADIQHILSMLGLLNLLKEHHKLALVVFYDFKSEKVNSKQRAPRLLNIIKEKYPESFDYFALARSPSNEIDQLAEFILR